MRIEDEIKLDFKDVLLKPKRSTLTSRRTVELSREFKFKYSNTTWTGVPIMASNMDGVGTFSMARVLQEEQMFTVIRKHYSVKNWEEAIIAGLDLNYVVICIGTNVIFDPDAKDYKIAKEVLNKWPDIRFLCIDVANGYQQNFTEFVKRIKGNHPEKVIIAGNVITGEMTEELIMSGADIVKCGIGPGSVCTTRIKTGVGVPQLSGIIECADAAHGLGGHIIGDGGCTVPGDVTKAFAGGSDFVMLGSMLAGHVESELELVNGQFEFYGMSSNRAMEIHGARKDGYRSEEGKAVQLQSRGFVSETLVDILNGVRSCCAYIGARRIKDMPKCATFVRVNHQYNTIYE